MTVPVFEVDMQGTVMGTSTLIQVVVGITTIVVLLLVAAVVAARYVCI
jgi:hypothetical protein